MKIQLTQIEITHLREVLALDLKEKARKVRNCNTATNDDVLAERIESYNRTQRLIHMFAQATTNDTFTDDDGMFSD